MTHSEKKNDAIIQDAYGRGVEAHRSGKPDINIYSMSEIMKFCAFSAGYWDSKRGFAI